MINFMRFVTGFAREVYSTNSLIFMQLDVTGIHWTLLYKVKTKTEMLLVVLVSETFTATWRREESEQVALQTSVVK